MRPFEAIFVPPEAADAVSDRAWLEGMLAAERALVDAACCLGLVPPEAAAMVGAACHADLYDERDLAEQGRAAGNPVEPLVRALRGQVGDEYAGYVHRGATSQDILDTAAMLVSGRGCDVIDSELGTVADLCAGLAEAHRATVMAARTLLQQAVPTTFGLVAAGWLAGLLYARDALDALELPAQLGGAAGTLATADGATGELSREGVDVVVAQIDLKMRSAIALRSASGNPIVLVDQLGRMAGLCGDDEIYRALLQQRRAAGEA